jgi:hypothetical protein
MAFPCSICSHKSGPMSACKREDPGKPRCNPSGRERGQSFSSLMSQAHCQTPYFSVFQMSLLEVEEIGESTPQGVALFLVGSDRESGRDQEPNRILRMYNLASLISLAKWAISQKVG